ncbi:MAG TPA: SRPBCC family protein [Gemmatimonadales bacterium]|nr:SRPBCC family protein [Gemmatimonadales bacterium]
MTAFEGDGERFTQWENLRATERERRGVNVGSTERWVSGLAGAALLGYSLRQRRMRALLIPLGGALLKRAMTGVCEVNRALGRNSARDEQTMSPVASLHRGEGRKIEEAVTINRPRDELYRFWRHFENLPRFMDNLESVTVLDDKRSHWVAKGPVGTRVEWDAEIHNEIENELIAWRSLPGADVDQAGSVHFSPVHNGGTDVRVIMRYSPPAGKLGDAVAHVLGDDPDRQIADDLRRFKQVMDAGEVPAGVSGSGSA